MEMNVNEIIGGHHKLYLLMYMETGRDLSGIKSQYTSAQNSLKIFTAISRKQHLACKSAYNFF